MFVCVCLSVYVERAGKIACWEGRARGPLEIRIQNAVFTRVTEYSVL